MEEQGPMWEPQWNGGKINKAWLLTRGGGCGREGGVRALRAVMGREREPRRGAERGTEG